MVERSGIEQVIPEPLLARFSDFLEDRMGLHFPKERWRDLQRGIEAASRDFNYKSAASCIEWLLLSEASRQKTEILASHLTVGETYFMRDGASFKCLEEHVLAELISRRSNADRRLRIWSAGCCTGEEAYSIALLLAKMIPDYREWHITILATDINPQFLAKAARGIYTDWSFRDTPPGFKEFNFRKVGNGRYELPDHIRRMVIFSHLNLANDRFPSLENNTNAMDIIFCRNVLMYFDAARAKKVAGNFSRALVDGGWLFVSATETSQFIFSDYTALNIGGRTLYRKTGSAGAAVPQPLAGLPAMPPLREEPAAERQLRPAPLWKKDGYKSPAPANAAVAKKSSAAKAVDDAAKAPASGPCDKALAFYEQGRYADSAAQLKPWLVQHPRDIKAMILLARIYANQGSLDDALRCCQEAAAVDKLNAGCCYLQAAILQEQDLLEEAAAMLRRALYLDQDFVLAHFALGSLCRRQGKIGESERNFENALLLLGRYGQDEILPESEGIVAGRLKEIIESRITGGVLA